MNVMKRVLPLCVKISSAPLGWAMLFVFNESRSLHALFLERIAHICENLEQFIYSLQENMLPFWCLSVMVRMCNSLLGFGGYLVLGNELADFGTSYHPHSQCCRISYFTPMDPPFAWSCVWSMICVQQMLISGMLGQKLGVFLPRCRHVSQMDGKPSCVVHIVGGEAVLD